ncbi:MAG: ribonuclease R [Candidatus Izemoplasmatales bacterium]
MAYDIMKIIEGERYVPADFEGLAALFGVRSEVDRQILRTTLEDLERRGVIAKNRRERYDTVERLGLVRGAIDLKRQGYGFVRPEGTEGPDVFIPRGNVEDAMDKDRVLVRITRRSDDGRLEGAVLRILERGLKVVVGEYFQGAVFPKNPIGEYLFKVRPQFRQNLKDHTVVKAEILRYSASRILDVKPIEIIGHPTDPGIEILTIVAEHGLTVEFPDEVQAEVAKIPATVQPAERAGRRDLTDRLIFTIDGEDTKDIDDAVELEILSDGNYRLGVHIADVSHYVVENTALDAEAYRRGTSVYLADRVIPMLPRELSNGICSLNPDVERLAMSCLMTIDRKGDVTDYEIVEAVIRSRAQMTYTKMNRILAGDVQTIAAYPAIAAVAPAMRDLAKILYDKRSVAGSINFETIEPKLVFDADGKVVDIVVKDRGISEGIIEEFMLIANETVAGHFMKLGLPGLFRIHENPDPDKLSALFKLAKELGYQKKIPKKITPVDLQQLLTAVDGTKFDKVINTLMLRSMAKARYSESNDGHYGLAFENYTHFTSPIRRYPDTTVHRLLRSYLFSGPVTKKMISRFGDVLPDIAEATSKAERVAMLCEREVMDMKKAEFMIPHVGEVFEGVVSTLTRFGMFVELPNTVEGLVHMSTFKEAMEFIEDKMVYLGISSRKEYTIGMVVKVKLLGANPLKGQVDFELV